MDLMSLICCLATVEPNKSREENRQGNKSISDIENEIEIINYNLLSIPIPSHDVK